MDAIAHTQVSGFCLVTLAVLLRAQQKMRDKSLPGRLFTALLWSAGALTIVDYGSALAQLGAWQELGIPLTYRLNAGGSILFYLLAACCCQLVFLYVEAELGRTWMEDGRKLALSAAPVALLLLALLTARDENGFCYLNAEGLRGSTLFWGAKLVGLAYLAAAFLRCSWTPPTPPPASPIRSRSASAAPALSRTSLPCTIWSIKPTGKCTTSRPASTALPETKKAPATLPVCALAPEGVCGCFFYTFFTLLPLHPGVERGILIE